MRRVCVVVTARPSYSRIKTALEAIAEHPELELQLVIAASALLDRYGTAARYVEEDGFDVAARVYMVLEGENPTAMAKTTGLGLLELATVLDNLKPDVVVTIADRYETIATAIAAAYMNIPVAHVQGGEVTGSIDEKVRHAVTKLADLHLVSTEGARRRLERMGEDPSKVVVTGCPSIDLAAEVAKDPALDFDPIAKYGGVGTPVDLAAGYLVVMQHPVTTEYEDARRHAFETLHAVAGAGLPALWFWPNVDAGADGTSNAIRTFREIEQPERMHFFKNMRPLDFLRLLANCRCLVGNSSAGIREGSYLGVPVVNVGSRQAGRERGANVLDAPYRRDAIRRAIDAQLEHGPYPGETLYGDGQAGRRIARELARAELTIDKKLTY
ncbi:MAG: UDP-N-acetylglucosamine 2-epimerase (hydrolyzing) [Acidobacteria bacterium]|nr:MAG: UDP-N-acetylglucosamine 2-epimerase (hydrolyzing) [Acidobacteriota bacterium]